MSGHCKREAATRADATAWRDRVIDDARSGEGLAAARAREISVDLIIAVAEIIAAYMAAGETVVSRTDLRLAHRRSGFLIGKRQEQRLMKYLVDRGHVDRTNDRDLIRPVRGDEMPLG